MIDIAFRFISNQLSNSIQDTFQPRVELGNIALVDAFQAGSHGDLTDKVVISLVNLEEEKTLKNTHFSQATTQANGEVTLTKRRTPIYLNLYVLFAVNIRNYPDALDYLSRIIGFFQKQNVFDGQAYPDLANANIEKLVFDIYSLKFEELNQMWSVLGGKYVPSVLYRVRIVAIQESPAAPTGIISKARSEEALI